MPRNKVLLLGDIVGSYRSQYIINYLAQRNYQFKFVFLSNWSESTRKIDLKKFYYFLINKIYSLIYLFLLPSSTHIFMLPMNKNYGWIFKLAHKIGKKTITDFYISSYYAHKNNKKINEGKFSSNISAKLKRYDKNIIENADKLIFLSKSEAEFYINYLGFDTSDIQYNIIPLATPLRSKAILPGLRGINDFFSICWWGKASMLHGFGTILDALKILSKDKSIMIKFFLFEINRERASILEKIVFEKGIHEITTVRYDISFSSGLENFLVEHCDFALGSFGTTKQARTVLTNKVVDSISMGIPIITSPTKAISEFNLDNEIVFLAEPNGQNIQKKILQLIEGNLDIDKYQQSAMSFHKKNFSEQRFNQDLNHIFYY